MVVNGAHPLTSTPIIRVLMRLRFYRLENEIKFETRI